MRGGILLVRFAAAWIVVVGLLVGLWHVDRAGAKKRAEARRFEPPFAPGDLLADRPGGRPWRSQAWRGRPYTLLYIQEGCPHCIAEVARWARAVRAAGGAEGDAGGHAEGAVDGGAEGLGTGRLSHEIEPGLFLVITASPASTWEGLRREVPGILLPYLTLDNEGSVGRRLGARGVPLTLLFDSTHTVRRRVVGQTSMEWVRTFFLHARQGVQP
ncbi:MAG: TlpA family protein disulfide reductase [Gemmatimonadota bacterium]